VGGTSKAGTQKLLKFAEASTCTLNLRAGGSSVFSLLPTMRQRQPQGGGNQRRYELLTHRSLAFAHDSNAGISSFQISKYLQNLVFGNLYLL